MKKQLEDFLNLASMSSIEKAESEDMGEDLFINFAEVVEVVKKLLRHHG